jgi:hypothetical protein
MRVSFYLNEAVWIEAPRAPLERALDPGPRAPPPRSSRVAESWSWSWSRGEWQAAGAIFVVGKAVLTLHPPPPLGLGRIPCGHPGKFRGRKHRPGPGSSGHNEGATKCTGARARPEPCAAKPEPPDHRAREADESGSQLGLSAVSNSTIWLDTA